jgi:predicted permease
MNDLLLDLRYGFRNLLKSPGFTTAALLALALGVGATTTIFSLVNGVVLKPLPYADPDRLVSLWEANHERGLDHEPLSPVNFLDYRALGQTFVDATAWWRPEVTLRDEAQEPVRVNTVEVSGNFHAVLGVQPILGAGFPDGVFYAFNDRIVLVSHRLWQSRFSSDLAIVGKAIRLNDDQFTVVGVMPAGFTFPGETDLWQRLNWDLSRHSRGAHFMEAVARLRPDIRVADVQRELDALSNRLGAEFAGTNRGWRARAVALHDEVVGYYRTALYVLLAAVGLLLLIACINVASLLLARAASRSREVAVRAAIGATRQRLLRQFLTESVVLAVGGGILGILLAVAAMKGIVAGTPFEIPRLTQVSIDGRVLAFASSLGLATAVLFGLLPALFMSRADLQQVLKEGGRGHGGHGSGRAHHALVIAEIALAVMLLAGAGLLVRSVARLTAEDPGFRPANVMTAGIQLTGAAYAGWPAVEQFHSMLVQDLQEQPGVDAAGASNFLPLAPGWRIPFLVRGQPRPARGEEPTAQYHSVSDSYFEVLGVPLKSGRWFDAHDTAQSRGVVIVNEALARRYFPNEEPVGRTVASLTTNIGPLGASLMKERDHVIIGVVGDVKNSSLQGVAEPALYHTARQFPFRHMYLTARGSDPVRLGAAIRDTVRRADPGLPAPALRPMDRVIGAAVDRPKFLLVLLAVFAGSALALAALGIYGLLSYAVTERQQELCVRVALGAQPGGLRWMILRQGLVLAVAGSVLGIAAAVAVARQIGSLLYGVSPADPVALAGVTLVALVSAIAACVVPAWRASTVDPLVGLKQ